MKQIIKVLKRFNYEKLNNETNQIANLWQSTQKIIQQQRQQNSYNDNWINYFAQQQKRIDEIQRIINIFKSISYESKTKEKHHQKFNWTACTNNNCWNHFSKKIKSKYFSKKQKIKQKKSTLDNKKHIVKMQFHSSQKKLSKIYTQFRKICLDK